jgi:hypothetical protein
MRKLSHGNWPMGLAFVVVFLATLFTTASAQKRDASPARSLTGHVLNRQDQAVTEAVVYLKNTKTLAIRTYISDPDGSYHFPGLSPNIDYEIYAEFKGVHSDTKTLSAFDNRKQIDITLRIK